jgi:hypothetical protein
MGRTRIWFPGSGPLTRRVRVLVTDRGPGGARRQRGAFIEAEVPGRLLQALRIHGTRLLGQHPVERPSMDTSGRKVAARAEVDVGGTSQVDSGRRAGFQVVSARARTRSRPAQPGHRPAGGPNGDGGGAWAEAAVERSAPTARQARPPRSPSSGSSGNRANPGSQRRSQLDTTLHRLDLRSSPRML